MAAVQELGNVAIGEASEEMEEEFLPIEKLEEFGIKKDDIKKAKEAGHYTIESLLNSTTKVLSEINGLSKERAFEMVKSARELCAKSFNFMSAEEYEKQREREIVYISTGSDAVDAILGGGIETKSITDIYGEHRCGKTQMCLTMAVTAQINPKRSGKVAYIDTEGSYRPDRVKAIAERYGLDTKSVINNVVAFRVHTWEQQVAIMEPLAARMSTEPFKLIIMDSALSLFRVGVSEQGELTDREQKLGCMLYKLKKLSEEYNVAVFLTNRVISYPSGGTVSVSDPKRPCGGHVIAHVSHCRLSVRKGKGEQRVLKVVQAPFMPEADASFAISNEGIVDYKA